jgi:FtsP/CotA-like multicopper oxidase with cupredoxin domain
MDHAHTHEKNAATFSTDPTGLPSARATEVVELTDGQLFEMSIEPVAKQIGEHTLRMLGYNGSIPGPTLRVPEGAEIQVKVENRGDLDATVHWHGLRLENAYYGQELGLYGNLVVTPSEADYWAPAHREVAVTLDDILIEDGKVADFMRDDTNYAAMGRFGNTMLAAGESHLALDAKRGEVVRFYLTNTANTRVFKVGFAGARMKLVGGDSGRCEREEFVESVMLAPSERAVVDVLFDTAVEVALEHRTPETVYKLGTVAVAGDVEDAAPGLAFDTLRESAELAELRERIAPHRDADPDKSLGFVAEMDFEAPEGPVVYVCPMHPEVVSETEGSCPECGMKLMPQAAAVQYVCPMHPEVVSDEQGKCPECGMKLMPASMVSHGHEHEMHHGHADEHMEHDHGHEHGAGDGIEWEDDMVEVNRTTTPGNTRWKLVDRQTGDANHGINWQFRVGDWVKIELVNEMDSDHPMHHPFHVHGAGRFVVLDRDGVEEDNLVWKDTVLITTGERMNILLEVTNPGRWMAHCHIAEHHESGMMFSFDVTP